MRRSLLFLALVGFASIRGDSTTKAGGPATRDPAIEAMLAEISAARIQARIEKLAGFGTRHTLSDAKSDTRGIGAARRWIKSELDRVATRSGGRLKVEFDSYMQEPGRRVPKATEVVNVVATLSGRQPESEKRFIVIGGHYDSIPSMRGEATDPNADAPGANDDASGTAVVMELAEVFASRDFDATLVFVAFAGEEQGLLGSTHFAKEAKAAGREIEAMITNDIVGNTEGGDGRRDNRTIRVFSEGLPALDSPLAARLRSVGGENDGPSRQFARYVRETAELYSPGFHARLVFRTDRYGRGGDHSPFLQQGYPAVRFTEPAENFARQHQDVRTEGGVAYGDVVTKVDFAYVAAVARLNGAVAASLALAPAPPSAVAIETRRLEYDTTLSWTAPPAPDLAGYEVVWRDTTSPVWEHALDVGNVTRVTLPGLSKDDFYFGVRAVDRQGHRSPVAFPLPVARPVARQAPAPAN
jgi:hypothetical protein